MDTESHAASLRALNRVGARAPDAQIIGGCCQFYVKKKAEGLDSPQAEAALFRMLMEEDEAQHGLRQVPNEASVAVTNEVSVAVPPPPPEVPSPAPPTSLDAAALAQRVKDLEGALATSEAERERLAKRVEQLETKPWRPKPRGRVPQGATGWDGVKGEWDYPPGYSGPRKRAAPASSPKRAKRRPAKKKKWDGDSSSDEQPPPQPPAVAAGAIFIDGGQCYLVYKREGRECNLETLDVAYYYPAKGPKPTEQNYLTVCKHSGVAEVTRRITATADAANACARADRKKRDGDRRRRDDEKRRLEAAALAALPPPKLPPPPKRVPALPAADLLGRAVRVVIADAPSDTRGTVDSVAHGVCRVAWADGSTSDVLAADVTAMLVPLVV